jgi:hypothetical protein
VALVGVALLAVLLLLAVGGGWVFHLGLRTGHVQVWKTRLSRTMNREGYWFAMLIAGASFLNGAAGAMKVLWDLYGG